jgi:hypothetical protein
MAQPIQIDVGQAFRDGRRLLRRKPAIWLGVAAGSLVMLGGLCFPIRIPGWITPVLFLIFLGPAVSFAQLLFYRALPEGGRPAATSLRNSWSPTRWLFSSLVMLCALGATAGATAGLSVVLMQVFVAVNLVNVGIIGLHAEGLSAGFLLTVGLFAIPSFLLMCGWQSAPLHVSRDGVRPFEALRRSWNTTFGSKRGLLVLALPFLACMVAYVAGLIPLLAARPAALAADVLGFVLLFVTPLVVVPVALSTSVTGYAALEESRAKEQEAAWFRKPDAGAAEAASQDSASVTRPTGP